MKTSPGVVKCVSGALESTSQRLETTLDRVKKLMAGIQKYNKLQGKIRCHAVVDCCKLAKSHSQLTIT